MKSLTRHRPLHSTDGSTLWLTNVNHQGSSISWWETTCSTTKHRMG